MQNVGTPRFYVNILEYLAAIGYTQVDEVYKLNPTELKQNNETETDVPANIFTEKSFVAFLGHLGGELYVNKDFTNDIAINIDSEGNPAEKGFSIASFDGRGFDVSIATQCENDIGSVVLGNYYDMPHSPDLSLKLSYEYDGIKTTQTKGGATLSNAIYTKPADWGDNGAWQLGEGVSNIRSGRRAFDLSFSYLSDTDLMAKVAASTNYSATNSDNDHEVDGYPNQNTLLDGTDFFSQVWNRTLGGHLPFIFQVNKNNNNPDQFAVCRFDMDTLTYDQVANNVYNVKLKIREVW